MRIFDKITKKYLRVYVYAGMFFISALSHADDFNLPDLGTPSDAVLSPVKEKEIRDEIVSQIYEYNLVISDPLVSQYIEQIGFRLAAKSENPLASFDFYMVNQNVVNASAYPGGLIVVYSGLFLKTDTESELAGVLAHEIAHATQRHISRFYAGARKTAIPTILGMLGAMVAAQYTDSDDAPLAIAAATTALQQQALINYTRANEYEADRVGINTLLRSDYDPNGMADFFEKLMRNTPSDERYQVSEYSRTHPLSVNRVSEAKNRAKESVVNSKEIYESVLYPYMKERVRILTEDLELDNIGYYQKLIKDKVSGEITDAERYGYALALHRANRNEEALRQYRKIKPVAETQLMLSILEADITSEIDFLKSRQMYNKLYDFYPESPVVIEAYIQSLLKNGSFESKEKARKLARKLILLYPENANYFGLLAITNQNLGKSIEANEALAMKEHLVNNNYRAVRILKNVLKGDLDYYQRSRIESKVTEYESLITRAERAREIQEERTGRTRGY